MDYFLIVKGVTGDTNSAAHKGAFEVENYGFGIFRPNPATLPLGGGPLNISLRSVTATPILLNKMKAGAPLSLTLIGQSQNPDKHYDPIKMVFANAVITDFNTSDSDGNGVFPPVNFSFTYTGVTYTYTPMNADGTLGTPITSIITFG